MRYEADACCPNEPPYPIVDSIRPKIKELLMYHFSCHGNLVTTAMRYMTDVYSPKEPPCQISNQYILINMESIYLNSKELLT